MQSTCALHFLAGFLLFQAFASNIGATPAASTKPHRTPGWGKKEAMKILSEFFEQIQRQPDRKIDPAKYIKTEIENRFEKGAIMRTLETLAEIEVIKETPTSGKKTPSFVRPGNPKLTSDRLVEAFGVKNLIDELHKAFPSYKEEVISSNDLHGIPYPESPVRKVKPVPNRASKSSSIPTPTPTPISKANSKHVTPKPKAAQAPTSAPAPASVPPLVPEPTHFEPFDFDNINNIDWVDILLNMFPPDAQTSAPFEGGQNALQTHFPPSSDWSIQPSTFYTPHAVPSPSASASASALAGASTSVHVETTGFESFDWMNNIYNFPELTPADIESFNEELGFIDSDHVFGLGSAPGPLQEELTGKRKGDPLNELGGQSKMQRNF